MPCIYYIHGGRMAFSSCYEGNYKAWGRMIAARGVAVAMVDFRNAVHADSAPEIAPFPAGLNDCVSGLKWVRANAAALGIDPARIVVAGESGGGNLALAVGMKLKQDGELGLIKGIYAMCPFIAGQWPQPQYPSSTENEGIFISVHNNRSAMAYGIEAFNARNPLAWPAFAQREDVAGSAAGGDQRQRVRPAARRGHRLLPAAARRRRFGALPPDHGRVPRHRDPAGRLPRHRPLHRQRHRRLRDRLSGRCQHPASPADVPERSLGRVTLPLTALSGDPTMNHSNPLANRFSPCVRNGRR